MIINVAAIIYEKPIVSQGFFFFLVCIYLYVCLCILNLEWLNKILKWENWDLVFK